MAARPLSEDPSRLNGLGALCGASDPMQPLYRNIRRVAPTDVTVLILGENGSGKELAARTIHELGPRRDEPFVAVNCGAIPSGLIEAELFGHERGSFTGAHQQHAGHFERAGVGTLFLDEIGEMPWDMQARLLRVLETRTFHRVGGSTMVESRARLIAATNVDVEASVRAGRFREDLLYRLAVFPIVVPPLRDRGDDVIMLAQHYLKELNRKAKTTKRLSRQAIAYLRSHAFTGNVRELRNVMQRAFILSNDLIEIVPDAQGTPGPARRGSAVEVAVGTTLDLAQRELILATLDHFRGDKGRTAEALGVSLKTLYNRLELYRQE